MEKYRQILVWEIIYAVVPAVIVFIILVGCFFLAPKILEYLEMRKCKGFIFALLSLLVIINGVWTFHRTSRYIQDLNSDTYITYIGEYEYLPEKGSEATDVYQLCDTDGIYVEAARGSIESTVQRCRGKVVYAEHSKVVLEMEVYEVIETRKPITIY